MASAPRVARSADENASDESLTGAAGELAALRASTAGRATARRPNRRGQAMREKLVQAATECFREYGYTKTRISDIVHRAGTAQGNFYRHFSSLDEIFVAALEPALRELATSSNRRLPTSDERDALIAVNVTFFQAYSRNRHLLRVMREAAAVSGNDGFGRLWIRTRADFVDRTERWLTGDSADLRALVEQVLGAVIDYDAAHAGDLVASVRVWLEHDRQTDRAARALHIHPNTLLYRVRRFEQVSGCSLTSTESLAEVWLALRATAAVPVSRTGPPPA